ncbi:MAG: His/Gly/Thr/Pro-type tRNA ligase C-terminal domain-containing protein [Candidatus Pacebacteria bacterium]|jgi:prolyl-tRNA synthetase|nr:His/Gly/Thr/Pro-type tRNA ligase C-terminal domain-containing protein [Candidatus Paceibacterota bacterium]MDD3072111.1 His/Gly/Thr/Pro-type tRNA ligase C-terminal domain-containing protein [Candidatus Paceibacterota bacterium]MDD3728824.1 His/Gly/Thr/Pro-type tRNA ligase C-terminal domain-containing protein [Candidatus Paceibacterota bacterium]MDD4201317.1 His/Gly/Thr/Pro-type tRNA ligase C-terminal domain-containing protein [Candidatus Paceibacterota bacterium]MDD4466989.1 His/Gly/Thr/Pro-
MRQSKLFSKVLREEPKDEKSINAKLLVRAGFVDKLMAGVYSFLPLGNFVLKKIENIIREEMLKVDAFEVFLPTLHPKENWQKTGRWEKMDDLYKLKVEDKEFALGPTHEEVISPLVKKFLSSYKDMPLNLFQFQNKFRNEKRAKSGLLRGREFLMKDLYSFNSSEEELENYYEKIKQAYKNIFQRCGIWEKTYLTLASGGSFSKFSHEYQTLTQAGEDIIYICKKCNLAINKEIIDIEEGKCFQCKNSNLKEEKAVEVGNIFKLNEKYSKPFDLSFTDKNGKKKFVLMGCYGIGLSRLMGTIVEVHHDNKGIIWPKEVSPFKFHLIEIGKSGKVKEIANEIYQFDEENILYDDREDKSAGEKFAEADLIGISLRIIVSDKTAEKESVEIKERGEEFSKVIKKDEIKKIIK